MREESVVESEVEKRQTKREWKAMRREIKAMTKYKEEWRRKMDLQRGSCVESAKSSNV